MRRQKRKPLSEIRNGEPVSYTHLDVYKRQVLMVLFLIFGRKKPENAMIYAKEGFVIVALAWICLLYTSGFKSGCCEYYPLDENSTGVYSKA